MSRRNELHEKLIEFLGSDNVYFNPPTGFKLKFPCIVYNRTKLDVRHANNNAYLLFQPYQVTYISKSVDDGEPWYDEDSSDATYRKLVRFFPYCSHERYFVNEGLSHDVYTIFY